jgi:flagellar biosynthesis/type III secretory pathway M-ring protein FliF/YscJ
MLKKIIPLLTLLPQITQAQFQAVQEIDKKIADIPTAETLNKILYQVNLGIAVVFIFFILLLIASGIEFLVAGGDEGSLEKAHKMWQLSLWGLTSVLIAYIVINLIKYFI